MSGVHERAVDLKSGLRACTARLLPTSGEGVLFSFSFFC